MSEIRGDLDLMGAAENGEKFSDIHQLYEAVVVRSRDIMSDWSRASKLVDPAEATHYFDLCYIGILRDIGGTNDPHLAYSPPLGLLLPSLFRRDQTLLDNLPAERKMPLDKVNWLIATKPLEAIRFEDVLSMRVSLADRVRRLIIGPEGLEWMIDNQLESSAPPSSMAETTVPREVIGGVAIFGAFAGQQRKGLFNKPL
ncbi:MAG TPA: hypothetical protein VNE40_00475 [Candidatus Dormibacteraeota bacterium]|nr:hypothetical protein [Candidatus Dormibacteraeota bacterium]